MLIILTVDFYINLVFNYFKYFRAFKFWYDICNSKIAMNYQDYLSKRGENNETNSS